ncbi:methyl-accepting chemotaxis protein [Acetonema longum]|uniref:Methyl-accepting chemotaxis sensory transducer n=1 Tax=Acetonema longum DSM 6540 TaxID=1009370 RepID=F7NK31_9FIRM|nr:methyl-accepting chemotaxis protein [Acetonema longum]EGO63472.1 methyl-accepting chemotaxis sensory transducer [Acetonema longum DSM 6540]
MGFLIARIVGRLSLKQKLIACFILVAAIPLILTTMATSYLSHSALVDSIYKDNRQAARFLAREMDNALISTVQLLQTLAETADIQSMDKAKQLAIMKKVTSRSDIIKTIIVNDTKGVHTLRTQGNLARNGEREYFKQIADGADYAFSDIQIGSSTGQASLVIAVPIRDTQKNFQGALLGVIDLEQLSKNIATTKAGQSGYAFLVDRQGKIVTHPDRMKMQQMADFSHLAPVQGAISGQNGVAAYTDEEGEKLAGYSDITVSGWGVVVQQPMSEAMEKVNEIRLTGIILTLLVILFAVLVGIFASKVITKPIFELAGITRKLAAGDLTAKANVTAKDEMGQLAEAFNTMVEHLRQIIRTVTYTASQVASSSQQLSATANEAERAVNQVATTMTGFAQGSQKQTAEVEKTQKIADNLIEISRDAANKAMSASDLSADMARAAETGGSAAGNAIEKINEIKEVTVTTAEVVATLGEKSKQIGQILDVISGIAGQTNLLALNAAIEAARAGEQGRGFAVVAEEVRKLAEQSRQATEQISQIVCEIQQQTDEAIRAMDSGNSKVSEGVDVVQAAGQALQNILAQIGRSVSMISDINTASNQQLQGMQQMVSSAGNVAVIARESSIGAHTTAAAIEEVTASMEEINSAAEALAKMAGELQIMVTKFKL